MTTLVTSVLGGSTAQATLPVAEEDNGERNAPCWSLALSHQSYDEQLGLDVWVFGEGEGVLLRDPDEQNDMWINPKLFDFIRRSMMAAQQAREKEKPASDDNDDDLMF